MTLRLVRAALEHWTLLEGYAVGHGTPDLRGMPIGTFCSYVHWWLTRNIDSESAYAQFEARLWRPPIGQAPAAGSPWSAEKENAAFAALKAGLKA